MRVLHVDTAREHRGGQTQLLHLALAQADRCAVAVPPDALIRPLLEAAGVLVLPVAFRGRLAGTAALGRHIRRFEPRLVASHTAHALAHVDRLGIRGAVHRRVDFRPSASAHARLGRSAGIVAVSGAVAAVIGDCGAPISVVHDGVHAWPMATGDGPRSELGIGTAPLVCSVGALVPHKGHGGLIDAVARLPSVHVAILGEGPLRSRLRRKARRLGVSDRVHLVGQRNDVAAWLAAADVFCHPSVEEGLGQAVIEALLAGSTVVATRAGGVPEVVEDLGILVPTNDAVALSRALRAALIQPARTSIQARSRLARRFSVAAMVRGTETAYARFTGAHAL